MRGNDANWRTNFLVEHAVVTSQAPAYCAVRNQRYMFVKYADGEKELYDLSTDPYELNNLAGEAAYGDVVDHLYSRLVVLCNPPPPGYTP
jgi:hypothetical protein